ncbi:MAG: DoxX family protein [Armatimonadetes bacterium]|nr:DoxX family protein [Armatimonadota bacterium]
MRNTSMISWAALVLRAVLGITFMAHGAQKLFGAFGGHGMAGFTEGIVKMGFQPAALWAYMAAGAEFFGGLLVLLGLAAEVGAAFIIPAMLVAIWKVHGPQGFFLSGSPPGYEYNLMILAVCIAIILIGPGRWALYDPFKRWRAGGEVN